MTDAGAGRSAQEIVEHVAKHGCVVCGGGKWNVDMDLIHLPVEAPIVKTPHDDGTGIRVQTMPVIAATCMDCGVIRYHSAKWLGLVQ